MSVRLLSYNIRYGGAGREDALASVIKSANADIVILQEATNPDVVQRLATLTGFEHQGAIRGHSLAYLSRLTLSHHAWHAIPLGRRRYLELVLKDSGLRLYGVHLSAVHSNVTERRRVWEIRSLLKGISEHAKGFHVVTGDFNTLAPGEELDMKRLPARLRAILWLTGRKVRWAVIKLMLEGGYVDAYRSLHPAGGYTFPTWDPHIRLDYAFVPKAFSGNIAGCEVVRDAPRFREASDHLPLLLELRPL